MKNLTKLLLKATKKIQKLKLIYSPARSDMLAYQIYDSKFVPHSHINVYDTEDLISHYEFVSKICDLQNDTRNVYLHKT